MIDPDAIWTYRASPVRAIDGDTIELLVDLGLDARMEIHVRLLGVDAPERNDPDPAVRAAALEATRFVHRWLLDAVAVAGGSTRWPLWIRTHKDRQSFTRYLADVWDGEGRSLADDLRSAGHVMA